MEIKYTKHFLNKLEDLFSETDYVIRYEKGNFKSGYCILNDTRIALINKYYTQEGKINCLIEILRKVNPDTTRMSEKNKQLYLELNQITLEL